MPPASNFYFASSLLALLALLGVLWLGLLSALLSGLLVYNLVQFAAPQLGRLGVSSKLTKTHCAQPPRGRFRAAHSRGDRQRDVAADRRLREIVTLLKRMAEIIDTARIHLPVWALDYVPVGPGGTGSAGGTVAARACRPASACRPDVGVLLVHIIVGMVIGGLIA